MVVYLVVGNIALRSFSGQLIQVAFVLREGRVRVISARPAHRKERKQYEEILRKISQGA